MLCVLFLILFLRLLLLPAAVALLCVPPFLCCSCPPTCSLSVARLSEVQKELAALEDQLSPLLMKYKQEKERLDNIRRLQNKRQELIVALEMAEQRQDLARIAGARVGGFVNRLMIAVVLSSSGHPCM